MQTIRLRVNEKVYKHLMWFLNKFSKDELQIIEEDEEFVSIQQDLQQELTRVEEGSAEFIDLPQLDKDLESIIRKHEA
ncbi:tRNA pseudouridine synthase A [Pontibacter diazotrophicus]|uniref:tRNA pseudouridine synthase A n=1 Tax=Pontibacter diazotrophicus TaxID=1400979 RepID=A0A3D8L711_9BACT|nr:tRNA pseudouridine synthase A [Pontibacter diazotrophicus]RDV13181.1 tRNA pseudouridine synthase A [Pontibacter diazotrophicus]